MDAIDRLAQAAGVEAGMLRLLVKTGLAKTPVLLAWILQKRAWIEGREYVAKDRDGVIVAIGYMGYEKDCERFLVETGGNF